MAQLSSSHEGVWSEEHDCIPLKQRLKLLLASKRPSDFIDNDSKNESAITITPPIDVVVKQEEQNCDSQGSHSTCAAGNGRNGGFSPEESHAGVMGETSGQGTQYVCSNQMSTSEVHADTVRVEKVSFNAGATIPFQCLMLSESNVKVKVECTDDILTNSLGNGLMGSSDADLLAIEMNAKTSDDFDEDLDHVKLNERRRMLLSRNSLGAAKPVLEGYSSWSNPVVEDMVHCNVSVRDKESRIGHGEFSICEIPTVHIPKRNDSGCFKTLESDSLNSSVGSCCSTSQTSALTTLLNVKVEPLAIDDSNSLNKCAEGHDFPFTNKVSVKSELEKIVMSYGDAVDHMLLRDRIKLLAPREVPNFDFSRNFKCLGKTMPSILNCSPIASESAKPSRINRPRKRRKTVTDSVETALEEDAPGLLEVLLGKGVALDEIKLYGEMESDEALDESSDDSFAELEDVISKLFFQRHSLLKLPPLRCTKGEKASYCLACLISLVEQARYLRFRNWPVEWGWCRDLQSFIFVFERHNRIVLERPEYGYATYFFELVDSVPVDWQIKRLVIAMKLPNCSRVTLIENRALVVGEDLSEGEARVLMEYGWIPNSGLGTMLNYCDRVVHDKKNESYDGSEWRSKIGKLLTNGYNGGTIVSTDIPKKVVEYSASQSSQIKLEQF